MRSSTSRVVLQVFAPINFDQILGNLCLQLANLCLGAFVLFFLEFANKGVPVYDSTVRYVPRFDHATIYRDIMNVWHRLLLIGIASFIHSHMMMEFLGGFVIVQTFKASS